MPTSKPADKLTQLKRAARNLDDQHAQIASLARQAEFLAGAGYAPALQSLLNELSERLQEHFEDEERLLQTLDFGALDAHKDSHLDLGKGLAGLLKAVSEEAAAATDVQQYISGQLRAHFLAGDADVDLFIKGKLQEYAAA
ncbi:MAG: hemerythrin domain-containing protein [Rhodocyclaceae bacterium]|nr:hemerythrin domain-containing protein [Rhodocyclaceae bacterium]